MLVGRSNNGYITCCGFGGFKEVYENINFCLVLKLYFNMKIVKGKICKKTPHIKIKSSRKPIPEILDTQHLYSLCLNKVYVWCRCQTTLDWNEQGIHGIVHCHTDSFDKNIFQDTNSSRFNNIYVGVTQGLTWARHSAWSSKISIRLVPKLLFKWY